MPDFSKRSQLKELLDRDDIPFADIKQNMQELEVINSRLGGHAITIDGLKTIINKHEITSKSLITICEIGCGGGDNLAAIIKWANKYSVTVKCIGIDINKECIDYAIGKNKANNINFICADYQDGLKQIEKPDIIFNSLFCHHFSDEDLIIMLELMKDNATYGCFINDLERNPVAYHSIRILTKIFSKSYLVKNDAPVSVLRGFSKNELSHLLSKAGIQHFDIKWKWAFRWLIIF